ncbi:MAG: hypothetical protein KDJ29_17330 [Hyphomicrobiales bacterium]|nr:hypothetical protein [Hyphomicrobiales bacterium]
MNLAIVCADFLQQDLRRDGSRQSFPVKRVHDVFAPVQYGRRQSRRWFDGLFDQGLRSEIIASVSGCELCTEGIIAGLSRHFMSFILAGTKENL